MSIDLQQDYFALFGLPRQFEIDPAGLERAYLDLQGQVHPDRHAHRSDASKRLALQWATRVNEAYRALRKPLPRARYLLELAGVDVGLESNTSMSPEFLVEQMEWREAVAEAREAEDAEALDELHRRLAVHAREIEQALADELDRARDLTAAAETVRRLMFLDKLDQEIDDAHAALES